MSQTMCDTKGDLDLDLLDAMTLRLLVFQMAEDFFKECPHRVLVLFLGGQFQEFHNLVTISQMCQISFHVSQPRTSGSITEGCANREKESIPRKLYTEGLSAIRAFRQVTSAQCSESQRVSFIPAWVRSAPAATFLRFQTRLPTFSQP